jgi:hypothetical protein
MGFSVLKALVLCLDRWTLNLDLHTAEMNQT